MFTFNIIESPVEQCSFQIPKSYLNKTINPSKNALIPAVKVPKFSEEVDAALSLMKLP